MAYFHAGGHTGENEPQLKMGRFYCIWKFQYGDTNTNLLWNNLLKLESHSAISLLKKHTLDDKISSSHST